MTLARERFSEGSSGFLRAQIVDQDGVAVEADVLTEATLTLYDVDTLQIINGRQEQSILSGDSPETGANDVTFEADGYFRWDLQASDASVSPVDRGDNAIVTSRRQIERHRAQFRFAWVGGAFHCEFEIEVVNLNKVDV